MKKLADAKMEQFKENIEKVLDFYGVKDYLISMTDYHGAGCVMSRVGNEASPGDDEERAKYIVDLVSDWVNKVVFAPGYEMAPYDCILCGQSGTGKHDCPQAIRLEGQGCGG